MKKFIKNIFCKLLFLFVLLVTYITFMLSFFLQFVEYSFVILFNKDVNDFEYTLYQDWKICSTVCEKLIELRMKIIE